MRPIFGSPVRASDVQGLTSAQGEKTFIRLCGTLVVSAIREATGDLAAPEWTERTVPDRGVDGKYEAPPHLLEAGGLVGPGRNVYQVKWRNVVARPSRTVIRELRRELTGALRDLMLRNGSLPDRYVLMVNVDLSRSDRASLSEALRKDCPEYGDRPLIIWGAAELAAAINTRPDIRHAFFSDGIFCTPQVARHELRTRYEAVGWPAHFVGYDAQLSALREFAAQRGGRLLVVTGPPYSGKTRTVLEALQGVEASVVWASDPSRVTEDHFRALDVPPNGTLAVVDNCDPDQLVRLERWARSRASLKTILISRWFLRLPDVPVVTVDRLSGTEPLALLDQLAHLIPYPVQDWILRIAGDVPGLIIYAEAARRDQPDRPAASSVSLQPREMIRELLREALLRDLSTNELEALQVLAILPQIGTDDDVRDELAAVAHTLDRDQLRVRQAIPVLEERHLLLRRGRFVEVVPELLGITLAAEVTKASGPRIRALWRELPPAAQARLVKRLVSLSDDADVGCVLDHILSPTGWFPTLDDLGALSSLFRMVAHGRPPAALAALQRLLEGLDGNALRNLVAGDLRRDIIWTLEALARHRDTFPELAELLFRLAEGENEHCSNNATGVLRDLFHWRHPEVGASHGTRIAVLRKMAHAPSPTKRALAAEAAAGAIPWYKTFLLHPVETLSPPEVPTTLKAFGDLWRFQGDILSILRELTDDNDPSVRKTAFDKIQPTIREIVRVLPLDETLHHLAEACFDALESLATPNLPDRQRAALRGTLDLIQHDLDKRVEEAPEGISLGNPVTLVKKHLERVRALLTDQSFEGRLKRWVGPRAWGDEDADLEAAGQGAANPSLEHISRLGAEACKKPLLLTEALFDWLLTDEAEHAWAFFIALGESDADNVWLTALTKRLGTPSGPRAFGYYVHGLARRRPDQVESILDSLSLENPAHTRAALAVIFALRGTPRRVNRLLSLVDRRLASPADVLRGIGFEWTHDLPAEDFSALISRLDDGTTETTRGIVEVLSTRLVFTKAMPDAIQEVAWQVLARSVQNGHHGFAHSWDRLASWLAACQPDRFLELLPDLVRGPSTSERQDVLDVLMDHAEVWKVLQERDRCGLILALLRIQLQRGDAPFWVCWCLERFVDPDTDAQTVLDFATRHGEAGAIAVVGVLNADRDSFWSIAAALLHAFPESERLASRLSSRAHTTGVVAGSFAPTWRQRLDKAVGLLNHRDPRVSNWARRVVDMLEELIASHEREDQERFVWDYRIPRRQLEEVLERRDSADRLWALRRILSRARTKDVLDLLTLEDIQEGLSIADLPEADRRKWEAYLAHWSQRPRE
jgi:hypothetical protein